MPEDAQESFDLDKLQQLVEMMEKHDLREVRLRRGNERWLLRRGPQEVMQFAPVAAPQPISVPSPAAGASSGSAPTAGGPAGAPAGTVDITSPMVGTFYRSPSPGEKAFVKEGDHVDRDTVVCLIEAMKFFNQIKAERAGTIVQILVNDGDAVDFGQPLFRVKPD
jgi:acetyl-CoA carboxylase biotin carboxyl carrier protein